MDEPADSLSGVGGLVRLRADLAYDGTGFAGWAAQPGQRTVQGAVEAALSTVLRIPVHLTVAGRTDAGVHASGQVAHCDVPAQVWAGHARRLLRRLAGILPPDVRVLAVGVAPPGFDARFAALSRRYVYRLSDAPWGVSPLQRLDTVAWPRPVDVAAAQQAGAGLRGLHDFAAFCKHRPNATTTRTLQVLDWHRDPDGLVEATVQADAFCHHMVRGLIGCLLSVGEGRRPLDWPVSLLGAAERSGAIPVAPAHGLTLVEVSYPDSLGLAARAEQTRARRS
ncbi:MAG: tRNA pseudouridine(38-40) synthase TruA [Geodermatophilaceae bacterium]|nr:tRNA pseudouridine(38-40) synthase TruA [Geodermatophilaceae bacterium]